MLIEVNGIKLYYKKTGSGRPLIMVHGNGETHDIFDNAIRILEKEYTVYAVDLRGHGKSSSVLEFHYIDMARDLKGMIDALELKGAMFYGFSDGGIIGLLLASKYQDLFSCLMVSGANINPSGIKTGWYGLFKGSYMVTKDPKMKMMLQEPYIKKSMLQKIKVPTIVLAGSRDMIKKEHTRLIADNIKNSTLLILRGEGHGSYIVHKQTIGRIIRNAGRRIR